MKFTTKIIKIFDNLELKIRHNLSKKPLVYAFIGSVGVVLIWRGVWMIADQINLSGIGSLVLGVFISASVGLFVSFFVGDSIIISGIKEEKRIDEKTEREIRNEKITLLDIEDKLKEIEKKLR